MSIKIKKCPACETKEDYLIAIAAHINDVQKGCAFIANKVIEAGINHDYTKIPTIDEFMEERDSGIEFKAGNWYPAHIDNERHHLNGSCPDDVNLIDVIEMLVDCTMAAKARNSNLIKMNTDFISSEILEKAFKNTVEMLENEIILENN
jgi:hypothetical protein